MAAEKQSRLVAEILNHMVQYSGEKIGNVNRDVNASLGPASNGGQQETIASKKLSRSTNHCDRQTCVQRWTFWKAESSQPFKTGRK